MSTAIDFHPELYAQWFGRGADLGRGEELYWVESMGQLHTDIYGLSTATASYVSPTTRVSYPPMDTQHPFWDFLWMERRTASIENGFVRCICEYAGFEGTPIPVEEWSSGVSEEPIQTHPNFEGIAGTPAFPLNGAVFYDENGQPTTDDSRGVFDHFSTHPVTDFSGVTSYLSPVAVRRVTSISSGALVVDQVGQLVGTMLCTAASSTKRGRVYQNVIEYRGAGPKGWNTDIY